MSVALMPSAMRLSEAIALYLAAAAPFGVAFFLRRRTGPRSTRALAVSTLAGLAWPLTSLLLLFRTSTRAHADAAHDDRNDDGARADERADRAVAASLTEVETLFEAAAGGGTEQRVRYALFAARRSVERFAGLARVSKGARADGSPTERDLALPRVAGRKGEDLLLAGRCTHRRNVLRLLLHRERARGEMLHALAELRELSAALSDACPAPPQSALNLSTALARSYELTLELLSNLDDERATTGVRRLLDAERARIARLRERAAGDSRTAYAGGGESCTTPAAVTASAMKVPLPTRISTPD